MKLLYQTHSPFARKTLVFAYEAGLEERVEVIHHETSPTNKNEEIYAYNPLGKVPILITETGEPIFDSAVICLYLDHLHDAKKLIPKNLNEQITSLRLQAIADGMSIAGISARWESTRRPEPLRYQPIYDGMILKIETAYDYIENNVSLTSQVTIGEIALATSLSWLEFRDLPTFRKNHPKLTKWYDSFRERKSMKATMLSGETQD